MRILILFLALIPISVFAEFDEDKIVEALQGRVKTVEKSFAIFHWEKIDAPYAAKFDTSTPEGTRKLVTSEIDNFLGMNAMYGLYSGLDPTASRTFGGEKKAQFRLVQISLPKGVKYLVVRDRWEPVESLTPLLGKECAEAFMATATNDYFKEGPCSEMKRRIFKKMGIVGVKYHWAPGLIEDLCSGKDRSAFIVTDSSWLKPDNLRIFTAKSTDEKELRQIINEILVRKGESSEQDPKGNLWPDVSANGTLSPKTKRWMYENLVNCQGDGPRAAEPEEVKKGDSAE